MNAATIEAIRLRYVANEETVEAIARAHGVTQRFVYAEAQRNAWPRRTGQRRARRPGLESLEGRAATVYERLLARLERRLDALDAEEATAGGKDAEEREIRALKELTGILDKLSDFENARWRRGGRISAEGRGGGDGRGEGEGAGPRDRTGGALPQLGTSAFLEEVSRRLRGARDAGGAGAARPGGDGPSVA